MRYLVTGGVLLATIAWLVLSYMPATVAPLPKLTLDSATLAPFLPWLTALTLALFLVIQLDLVRVTGQWFRHPSQTPDHAATAKAISDFGLSRGWELFWTVLPVLGTVLLTVWLAIVR